MSFRSHCPLPLFLEKRIDTPQFQEKCHAHHITGLLYGLWPEQFGQDFYKNAWKRQWQQNEIHLHTLQELSHPHLKPVLLKGMAILESYYPQSGCRFMSDIDLLIPKDQLQSYTHHLSQHGFTNINKEPWKADKFKSVWEKDIKGTKVFIELHTKLFYHTDCENWNYEDSKLPGYQVLCHEDQLLHLLGHAGFQHTFSLIYWLFDIYFFLMKEHQSLDWIAFMNKSKSYHLHHSSLAGLYLVSTFFSLPLELNDFLKNHLKSLPPILRDHLTEDFLWHSEQWGLAYFTCKHLLKDSWIEALRYDLFWILNKIKMRGK